MPNKLQLNLLITCSAVLPNTADNSLSTVPKSLIQLQSPSASE